MTALDPSASLSLPFSIDEQSFSIWLAEIEKQDKVNCLQALTDTLKQLKKATVPADIRSVFLEKIATIVFKVSEQLKKTYIKSYFPFSEEDKLKVSLSTNCAFEMAENYALICKDTSFKSKVIFSQTQKELILLNSIQAMANVLLYKAIVYEKPKKGFWSLCYLFYLFAKQNEALESSVTQGKASFVQVFKQLLVFELSNTQQFNTEEIYTIFNLLNSLTGQVKLLSSVPEKALNSTPCINLRVGVAPAVSKDVSHEPSPYIFYISSLDLIKQLFDLSVHKKSMPYKDKVLVFRLIKALSMNQSRKNKRELADNELLAEVGFDKFIEFLLHQESLLETKGVISYDVNDLSIDKPKVDKNLDDSFDVKSGIGNSLSLHIEDDDESVAVESIDSSEIWVAKETKVEIEEVVEEEHFTNAVLIDQSKLGFCIRLQEEGVVTKVGELIHLSISSISIVTVVRRIIATDNDDVMVGVEVLGYDPEILHIMDIENKSSKNACVLVNLEGVESIVIKVDDYHNEKQLYVDRNEKVLCYQVEKTFETSTAIVKHLKVSLS